MRYLFAILMMGWLSIASAKDLVVSTYPLYLIAKDVTAGIEEPSVLLMPHQTGHDAQLTPKNRQMIADADLIIWFGKQYEVPLQQALNGQKKAISILESDIVKTFPQRDIKANLTTTNGIDPHVWLEPNNAVRIAFFIAASILFLLSFIIRSSAYIFYVYYYSFLNYSDRESRLNLSY